MNTVLEFLEANWQRLHLEPYGLEAGRMSCIILTPRFRASRQVVVLVLPRHQPQAALVAKLPRLPETRASLAMEAANLQAVHLNLPFAGDEEFARLHAAIRLVLPILPALAASSPIVEGRVTGLVDSRLEAYRTNSRRFASITGQVIPERVYTRADYEERILQPIYRDLEPLDPEGVLRHEFVNARGAIARFSRGSIEIRLIDVQEAPRADLAVLAAVVGVLKLLVRDAWSLQEAQRAVPVEPLHALLSAGIAAGEHAEIVDDAYLALFGYRHRGGKGRGATTAGDLWRHLVERSAAAGTLDEATFGADLQAILDQGPLARRILHALGTDAEADRGMEIPRRYLREVWDGLCDCLGRGERFTP